MYINIIFTESQELGTEYCNSYLFACLFACPSPPKRLRDLIINYIREYEDGMMEWWNDSM